MKLSDIFNKFNRVDLLSEKVDGITADTYRTYMNVWYSWLKGNVRKFHTYTVYNGQKNVKQKRRSAGMAKTICEDWASLLLNEKTDIVLDDEAVQAVVDDILNESRFWLMGNKGVERSFALGIGAFVVRVDNLLYNPETGEVDTNKSRVKIDFINGTKCYPFTIDDNDVVECGFVSQCGKKVNISMHLLNEAGNYEIHNISATRDSTGGLSYNEENDYYVFDTGSPLKWFQILQPNVANNIDPNSPLGISVYANAIDALETVDIIFDSFSCEYQYGRKRVYASAEAISFTKDGEEIMTFDPNDIVFYRFPKGTALNGADDKPFVQESTGALRSSDLISGMNQALNFLSQKCGLGENRYRFDQNGISTATQVISENSKLYQNLRKHEILLEDILKGIIRAVLYASNKFTAQTVNENAEITIKFDDSIIEDKQSERISDRQDVSQGLMTKVEYRVKWYNQTEEDAKKWLAEYQSQQPKVEDFYGG